MIPVSPLLPAIFFRYSEIQDRIWSDEPELGDLEGLNCKFVSNEILRVISMRPFSIDRVTDLCLTIKRDDVIEEIFENSIFNCFAFAYRILDRGLLSIQSLKIHIRDEYLWFHEYYSSMHNQKGEFEEAIKFGCMRKSLFYALKFDDLELFEEFIRNPQFKLDSLIDRPILDWSKSCGKPTTQNISAFFGSIRCFKHIFLCNKIDLYESLLSSIYGGNMEVFHLHKSCQFSQETMMAAANSMRNDIFTWLLFDKGLRIYSKFETHNLKVFQFLISKFGCSAKISREIRFLLSLDYGFLPFLVNYGFDINSNEKEALIHEAIKNKDKNMYRYLIEYGADINIENNKVFLRSLGRIHSFYW